MALHDITKKLRMYTRHPTMGGNTSVQQSLLDEAADEIDRLRHPFRNADALDWEHLFKMLPDSGHGRFWKEVLTEAKAALAART